MKPTSRPVHRRMLVRLPAFALALAIGFAPAEAPPGDEPAAAADGEVFATINAVEGRRVSFSTASSEGGMGRGRGRATRSGNDSVTTLEVAENLLVTTGTLARRTQDFLPGMELPGGLENPVFRGLENGGLSARIVLKSGEIVEIDILLPPEASDAPIAVRPKRPLSKEETPQPDTGPTAEKASSSTGVESDFWSLQPPKTPPLPPVKDETWPRTAVDRFVLAGMERVGLAPAPDAGPATLVRRLYFVVCGLPPSPEEVAAWTRGIGPHLDQQAIARLVDTLLDSPRFGERWGRHWLDVARFGESTGGDANNIFSHAWRYRDYVIDAFNGDKPFDRFVLEQLAGDLLPAAGSEEWAQNLVATGFLATGQMLVGEVDTRKFFADLVDEQIDATTRAFLGATVACARCHDHKTDPIAQEDYYALAAIFRNTETHYGLLKAQARQSSTLLDASGLGLPAGRETLTPAEYDRLVAERDAADRKMAELMKQIRGGGGDVTRANLRRSRTQRDGAENALQSYDSQGNPLTFVMGAQDREDPLETRVLSRGELDRPGPYVEPGFLQAASPPGGHLVPGNVTGSGRLQLAGWIASPANPLTARVIANRIWHWSFGQGLVRTPDDFGATGDRPSHPALLDFLAVRMVERGWSIKQAIREILLSRAWQQSSAFHPSNFEIDPDNRFLWRANPRRLEAEALRDSMLAVGGNLEIGRPATPLLAALGEGGVGQNVFEPEIRAIEANCRSIYLPRVRNVLPEFLELFDAPDAGIVSGARDTTTVPLQSLYLLNSAFARKQAVTFADRVASKPVPEQVDFAYMAAFGRLPSPRERELASAFARILRMEERGGELTETHQEELVAWCQALMCTAEFGLIE